jgi:hypothetical protein
MGACASPPKALPGTELEEHAAPAPAEEPPAENTAVPSDHAALSAAFDPQKPVVASPVEHNVPSPPAPLTADDSEAKRVFTEALAHARAPLATADEEGASATLKTLATAAEAAGPVALQQYYELEVRVLHRLKEPAAAVKSAERWLKRCGPTRVEACRRKALGAVRSNAEGAGGHAVRERAATVAEHDACLLRAEASPSSKPPCLGAALAFYQREGDALMAQRVLWARTRADPHVLTAQAVWDVEKACTHPRCSEVRRLILKAGAASSLRADDVRPAALMAFREQELSVPGLPADQRAYARTALTEQVCAALDAQEGAGACRKLEKETLGHYQFRDFSREASKGEGLPPAKVKVVNEQFSVLIESCLAEQIERMEPPSAERFLVRWVVTNEGRVDQVHMDKKDQEDGLLAQCLRGQFAFWRYPRYRGELQNVEQTFLVSAREKRTYSRAAR